MVGIDDSPPPTLQMLSERSREICHQLGFGPENTHPVTPLTHDIGRPQLQFDVKPYSWEDALWPQIPDAEPEGYRRGSGRPTLQPVPCRNAQLARPQAAPELPIRIVTLDEFFRRADHIAGERDARNGLK